MAYLTLGIAWLVFPVAAAVLFTFWAQDRWMLQQQLPRWWFAAGALVWLAWIGYGMLLVWPPNSWRHWVGLAALGYLAAGYGGSLVITLANCWGDRSPGQPVVLVVAEAHRLAVRLKVEGDAFQGVTFYCPNSKWAPATRKGRAASIHRGRLGLWWAEFQ